MRVEPDLEMGFSYHRSYICRWCGELIHAHNRHWDHIGDDYWLGPECEGRVSQARPIPMECFDVDGGGETLVSFVKYGCPHLFPITCVVCGKGNRLPRRVGDAPHVGERVRTFCWRCMDHMNHVRTPDRCLAIYDEEMI